MNRRSRRSLGIESLENRQMLAAAIGVLHQQRIPNLTVEAGTQDVPAAQVDAYVLGGGKLSSISFASARGLNFQSVDDFDLRADLLPRGKPDGFFETVIARDVRPTGDSVSFNVNPALFGVRGTDLMVTADFKADAPAGRVRLANAVGLMPNGSVYTVGVANPVISVIASSHLAIAEKSGPASDTAVANQRNLNFGRVEARATGKDLLITTAQFTVQQGQIANATNWSLWSDTDRNGTVDTIVGRATPQGNLVTFDIFGGGTVITMGQTALMEVHADAASSLTSNPTLQIGLTSVIAETLNEGTPLPAHQIGITRTPQTLWSFVSQGNLIVTRDATPVRSHDVLGGTLSDDLLRVQARSEYEDIDVTYIGIDVTGPSSSIDRIELFLSGQTTPFAVASVAGARSGDTFGVVMNGRNLIVPKGSDVDILARARVRSDVDGGVRGEQFALAVDTLMARGEFSTNEITPSLPNGSVTGPAHRVVMSKVSGITNANPDANGTAIPIGAERSIGQFKFTGAANSNTRNGINRSVISEIAFDVNATNVAINAGGFSLFNKADSSSRLTTYRLERMDGSVIPNTGTVTGVFRVIFTGIESSLVDSEISSGSDATLVLGAEVTNAKISNAASSTLQTSIRPAAIRWIDRDAGGLVSLLGIEWPDTSVFSTSYQS